MFHGLFVLRWIVLIQMICLYKQLMGGTLAMAVLVMHCSIRSFGFTRTAMASGKDKQPTHALHSPSNLPVERLLIIEPDTRTTEGTCKELSVVHGV